MIWWQNPWLWAAAGAGGLLLLTPRRAMARGPGAGLLAQGRVTSHFGPRKKPDGTFRQHWGVDIVGDRGTEVRAARGGVVADVSPDGQRKNYGNLVIIEHSDGTLTLYAHLESFAPGLRPGLNVSAGTVIGYVGSSQLPLPKMKMWPHLHFEVLKRKVTTRGGRIIVNPQTPDRHEPEAWLRRQGRPISDIA